MVLSACCECDKTKTISYNKLPFFQRSARHLPSKGFLRITHFWSFCIGPVDSDYLEDRFPILTLCFHLVVRVPNNLPPVRCGHVCTGKHNHIVLHNNYILGYSYDFWLLSSKYGFCDFLQHLEHLFLDRSYETLHVYPVYLCCLHCEIYRDVKPSFYTRYHRLIRHLY